MTRKGKDKIGKRIFELREYQTGDGKSITAKVPIDGGAVEYMGFAKGRIVHPDKQVAEIPYTFPIEVDSIEEAFANAKEANDRAWADLVKDYEEVARKQSKRISVAGNVPGNDKGLRIVQ